MDNDMKQITTLIAVAILAGCGLQDPLPMYQPGYKPLFGPPVGSAPGAASATAATVAVAPLAVMP